MMSAFLFAHLLYILQVSEIKIGFRCRSIWSGLETPTELDRFGSEVFGNIPSIVLRSNRYDMVVWPDLALLENRRIT